MLKIVDVVINLYFFLYSNAVTKRWMSKNGNGHAWNPVSVRTIWTNLQHVLLIVVNL